MNRIVTRLNQATGEEGGELRVDQKLHAAPRGTWRFPAVLAPNSRAARAADCRLPVADGRVNGDPIET